MYIPTYQISDRLLNAVAEVEISRASLAASGMPAAVKSKMEKRTKSLNIFHLAHMLGATVSLNEAAKLAQGQQLEEQNLRATLIANFRNVLEFNRSSVASSYTSVDVNLLTHLNKVLLTNWKESWEAKLRTAGEDVDATLDNWAGLRDPHLESSSIHQQLVELLEWYKSGDGRIHSLLRAAVSVYRFIEIAPFVAANKLTAMAALDFILYREGYVSEGFIPVARSLDLNQDEYLEAWAMCREKGDLSMWIERFVRSLRGDLEGSKEEYTQLLGEQEKSRQQPFLDLNKRQLKILRYLQTIPTVQREDYCQMMDVSTMTAYRDLTDLVDKKLIKIEGQGRGTKYMLYNR